MKRSAVRNSWLGLTISTSRIEDHYTCILELPVELVPRRCECPLGINRLDLAGFVAFGVLTLLTYLCQMAMLVVSW